MHPQRASARRRARPSLRRLAPLALAFALALLVAAEPGATAKPKQPKSPLRNLSCTGGAARVSSADALRGALSSHRDACVLASVGDVDLGGLGDLSGVVVASENGGAMGEIELASTTGLTIRGARFRSIEMRGASGTKLYGNVIGGTPSNRVYDELIFMPTRSDNVTIQGNDIGWTVADDSGNTGYGCRCYGETNGLRFIGNKVHDIAADGFQGTNGANVVIDRNEFGPVGANPDSEEHSDNIQIVDNGPGLRITNNWIHNQGYYAGQVSNNSGSIYVHGGTGNSVLIENNLIEENQGRTEICGLGTGGTDRSNIVIRRNTWLDGGLAYTGFPSFEWDCDGGSGNRVERNIALDPDGGFAADGSAGAASWADNIWGRPAALKFDDAGNCVSNRCNPKSGGPIGFRTPPGVRWHR